MDRIVPSVSNHIGLITESTAFLSRKASFSSGNAGLERRFKMNIMIRKIHIVSLAVFVGLGTCSLVNGVPILHAAKNRMTSDYVFSRNFSHRHLLVPKVQQTQGASTTSIPPADTAESENWAGYIDSPSSSSGYTSVSGSWIVPNISARQQNAAAAQWIGLGGSSSPDLLQMGTSEQLKNGQIVTEVFWEKLPAPAQTVMTVPIGSTINATISPSANSSLTWNLTFTVNGQTQTIHPVTLDSSYAQGIGTSAEWISEEPSTQNDQLVPLAYMGTVSYQAALVNDQALSSEGNQVQPIALVSSHGNILIAPSALGTDGESFSTNDLIKKPNTNATKGYGQNGNPRSPSNSRHLLDSMHLHTQ
ncbi:Peptidase A4 family [Candidatus Desulfosporosinus infrequens]|uniref:Peptidase A4 family n=1 Tax=Candidatus Desulfosporosinus infrequens TaxID=2043169 RepID=A0A2U3LMZ4_9FIRM|nr:Peptidase A4 family [Candidatus Desulfosporosinus infrequens]